MTGRCWYRRTATARSGGSRTDGQERAAPSICSKPGFLMGIRPGTRTGYTEAKKRSGDIPMGQPPPLPLSGITVVSLEQAIAAPLASRHLADWGARGITLERHGTGQHARA